jgi:hypothetical protein
MTTPRKRRKPEDWPGAKVHRAVLRPDTHRLPDVLDAIDDWLEALALGPAYRGYYLKHLVLSVDTRDGKPKGRRYSARVVLWPVPERKTAKPEAP